MNNEPETSLQGRTSSFGASELDSNLGFWEAMLLEEFRSYSLSAVWTELPYLYCLLLSLGRVVLVCLGLSWFVLGLFLVCSWFVLGFVFFWWVVFLDCS